MSAFYFWWWQIETWFQAWSSTVFWETLWNKSRRAWCISSDHWWAAVVQTLKPGTAKTFQRVWQSRFCASYCTMASKGEQSGCDLGYIPAVQSEIINERKKRYRKKAQSVAFSSFASELARLLKKKEWMKIKQELFHLLSLHIAQIKVDGKESNWWPRCSVCTRSGEPLSFHHVHMRRLIHVSLFIVQMRLARVTSVLWSELWEGNVDGSVKGQSRLYGPA